MLYMFGDHHSRYRCSPMDLLGFEPSLHRQRKHQMAKANLRPVFLSGSSLHTFRRLTNNPTHALRVRGYVEPGGNS